MNKDKKADNLSYDKKKVIYDLDNKIYYINIGKNFYANK